MSWQSNFKQAVNAALARYTDWDIVKLNAIRSKWPVQQHQLDGYALNAYLGSFTGTGTYLITRTAAARLLPQMLPIKRPIDHELDRSGVHGLRHFGMSPFPSQVLGASESTITGTNYQGVQKFPRWQRMPAYWQRWRNFASKAGHLLRGA